MIGPASTDIERAIADVTNLKAHRAKVTKVEAHEDFLTVVFETDTLIYILEVQIVGEASFRRGMQRTTIKGFGEIQKALLELAFAAKEALENRPNLVIKYQFPGFFGIQAVPQTFGDDTYRLLFVSKKNIGRITRVEQVK